MSDERTRKLERDVLLGGDPGAWITAIHRSPGRHIPQNVVSSIDSGPFSDEIQFTYCDECGAMVCHCDHCLRSCEYCGRIMSLECIEKHACEGLLQAIDHEIKTDESYDDRGDYDFDYQRNPDEDLRKLEHQWRATQENDDLHRYAVALIRSGDALRAFTILLENDAHPIIKELTKNGCPSLIPSFPDARARVGGLRADYGESDWAWKWNVWREGDSRFSIERVDNGWQLNDYVYGTYFSAESRSDARQLLAFAEAYVRRHGDIDLNAFPNDLDSPLRYDNLESVVRHWNEKLDA